MPGSWAGSGRVAQALGAELVPLLTQAGRAQDIGLPELILAGPFEKVANFVMRAVILLAHQPDGIGPLNPFRLAQSGVYRQELGVYPASGFEVVSRSPGFAGGGIDSICSFRVTRKKFFNRVVSGFGRIPRRRDLIIYIVVITLLFMMRG